MKCSSQLLGPASLKPHPCFTHRLRTDMCVCQEIRSELGQGFTSNGQKAVPLKRNVLGSISYLSPLANKISFNEWHVKHSRAPSTLICLPCYAIFACSKVGTWDENFAIQMNPWIRNFLLLVISSHKSIVWRSQNNIVGLYWIQIICSLWLQHQIHSSPWIKLLIKTSWEVKVAPIKIIASGGVGEEGGRLKYIAHQLKSCQQVAHHHVTTRSSSSSSSAHRVFFAGHVVGGGGDIRCICFI